MHWFIYPAAQDATFTLGRYNLFKKNFEEGLREEGRRVGLARYLLTLKEAQKLDRSNGNHYLNGFPLFWSFNPFGSMRSLYQLKLSNQAKSKKQEEALEVTI